MPKRTEYRLRRQNLDKGLAYHCEGKQIIEFDDWGAWLFEALEYAFYFLWAIETPNLDFLDDSFRVDEDTLRY